jgi:hypothetical protein
MTAEEQNDRRKVIRDIMIDPQLSQSEKSKTIQSLMDGRRRSSGGTRSVCSNDGSGEANYVSSMANAAAAAAEFYSSDDSGDAIMDQADNLRPEDIAYGYNHYDGDDRSIASEITHTSHYSQQGSVGPNTIPPGASYRQIHGRSFSLQDWNDNDRAIAAANAAADRDSGIFHNHPAQVSRLMEKSRPPCTHYDRNCTIVSPCCGLAFGCRICHDECPVLPPPIIVRRNGGDDLLLGGVGRKAKLTERRRSMPVDLMSGDDEENHHPIDRFAIREIICRECCTRQSSKT